MITNALVFFNVLLGLISFMPCLMAGGMSMDSPQAQHSVLAHLVMYILLSFPLVCWICAGLSYYFKSWMLGLFPICEAVLFISTLWRLSNE
jgi:hypothetical protein